MIVDTMTKLEVMELIRSDCDEIVAKLESKMPEYRKRCLPMLGTNKKKFVHIPVPTISSEQGLVYKINLSGNESDYFYRCTTSFYYKGAYHYVDLTKGRGITVFSSHCLDRYAERVLHDKSIGNRIVFADYLDKGIDNSFFIVLSSRTHEYCIYYVRTDALFLGDIATIDKSFIWFNTCLSVDELFESEYKIYNTLGEISNFVKKLKFDPIRRNMDSPDYTSKINKYLAINSGMIPYYKKYLQQNYMMYLLQKELGIDKLATNEAYSILMNELKDKLLANGIVLDSLDPYNERDGIAIKGELEYIN